MQVVPRKPELSQLEISPCGCAHNAMPLTHVNGGKFKICQGDRLLEMAVMHGRISMDEYCSMQVERMRYGMIEVDGKMFARLRGANYYDDEQSQVL